MVDIIILGGESGVHSYTSTDLGLSVFLYKRRMENSKSTTPQELLKLSGDARIKPRMKDDNIIGPRDVRF